MVLIHKHMHTEQNFNNNNTGKLQTDKQKSHNSHAKNKKIRELQGTTDKQLNKISKVIYN